MAGIDNLTPFDSKRAAEAGRKGGTNKKGSKHISTWIQELLNDEEFTTWIPDTKDGWKEYKGAPIKAVVQAQLALALKGDHKAFDLLGKYGYGTKQEVDITSGGERIGATVSESQLEQLIRARSERSDT